MSSPDDKIWLYCTIGQYQIPQLGSLYLGKYCTFVCATLFPGIKLIGLYSRKQKLHIQKYDGLENIENPSRALEVTLGTDTNLGHNHTKI